MLIYSSHGIVFRVNCDKICEESCKFPLRDDLHNVNRQVRNPSGDLESGADDASRQTKIMVSGDTTEAAMPKERRKTSLFLLITAYTDPSPYRCHV